MKIGLIKHRYFAHGGGSERYTNGLIAGLRERGHELHVFAGETDRAAEGSHVQVHIVKAARSPSFLRQLSFARGCERAIKEVPCDLYFSLERTTRQHIARAGGGCHREYLNQWQRHLPWSGRVALRFNPLHSALLVLEKQTFSTTGSTAIIANSNRGKAEIVSHYRYPAERIHVIHNGVDCERFKPAVCTDRDSFVLLFVGSGFERKGLQFAIAALARLPAHTQLRVAGKGDVRRFKRLAERFGVANRVHFLGVQNKIEHVYHQGDILLHPAIYEPFSNACLEAMASGLPVVTSSMNGASEVITPGVNGAVVEEPSDTPTLAGSIELFLDPKTRRLASESARQTAQSLPTSLNVTRTLEVIEKVAKTSRNTA